jgi:hypothetical protein
MLNIYLKNSAYENNYILKHHTIFQMTQDHTEKVPLEGKENYRLMRYFYGSQTQMTQILILPINITGEPSYKTCCVKNKVSTFIPTLNAHLKLFTEAYYIVMRTLRLMDFYKKSPRFVSLSIKIYCFLAIYSL